MRLPPLEQVHLVGSQGPRALHVRRADGSSLVLRRPRLPRHAKLDLKPGAPLWTRQSRDGVSRLLLADSAGNQVLQDSSLILSLLEESFGNKKLSFMAGYHEFVRRMPHEGGGNVDILLRVHELDMLRRCWIKLVHLLPKAHEEGLVQGLLKRLIMGLEFLAARRGAGDEAVLVMCFLGRCSRAELLAWERQLSEIGQVCLRSGVKACYFDLRSSKQMLSVGRQGDWLK